ncbi:endolytic transglycosylase MltG [Nocardia paucivorans]|uniref:endolytic transglycosylase MltG n=1 Tax=Nocardia paucivorans TaxID=114259 RepID=UPI000313747C|nr:endolytic transglycosylase MltG [Nocardia paucivorans]
MTDRWAQVEARLRQSKAERRYKRDETAWARAAADRTEPEAENLDDEWAEWDAYEDDDTTVIPRYVDDEDPPEPEPEPRPRPRRARPQPRQRTRTRTESGRRRATPRRSSGGRAASRKTAAKQRGRRKRRLVLGAFAMLLVLAAMAVGWKWMNRYIPPEDFAGPSGPPVVVQVREGETALEIAEAMHAAGVVASPEAFYEAAVQNPDMNTIQPGYYAVPQHSPATEAVTALVAPESRVGHLVISEGRQLHDQHDVNTGARKEGIYTKIAAASCIGTEPERRCVTYEQLAAAGAGTDLAALGVPEWAMDRVRTVPDRTRQLEGLIAAGSWNFDPTGTPEQILRQLVSESARNYEATGLLQENQSGLSPYETLIAASLVEREALPQDMGKVARVITNRLEIDQPLQFDSTVNYALDTTEVATTDADREQQTPWNTYAMAGLPATPISSPSLAALRAMEKPEPGPWLYFVTIDKQGTTLFTESYSEHLRNIDKALESGILDSGR